MSDLLAPILYVVDDEVDIFWCFSGLMERMVSIILWQWNFIMVCYVLQMSIFEPTQEHTKERIKRLHTLVMIFCPNFHYVFSNVLVSSYVAMQLWHFIV